MCKRLILSIVLIVVSLVYAADSCRAKIQTEHAYVVAYGSLMNKDSLATSLPQHADLIPVEVSGYKRSWDYVSDIFGLKTIFLAVYEDSESKINAALIKVDAKALARLDQRERRYCRKQVSSEQLKVLNAEHIETQWPIYIYAHSTDSLPTSDKMAHAVIVQSYVDVFLSGCIELETTFGLKGFAKQCVTSTTGWVSAPLINDRLYPRRPWVYQSNAMTIDRLLLDHDANIITNRRFEYDQSTPSSS